jgi:hypothetical protein
VGGDGFVFTRQQPKHSDSKVACDAGGWCKDSFDVALHYHYLFCNSFCVSGVAWRNLDYGYVAYYVKRTVHFPQFFFGVSF